MGHALEIVQADCFARFNRLLGKDVVFQTGTDEHGVKNWTTAKNEGPFSGVSNFSVDTMKKTFNDGKFINIGGDVEKLVKFRNNNFTSSEKEIK